MKLIGLMTENPRTYYEVLEVLREKKLKFVSLEFGESIPVNVGAVITTEGEKDNVPFDRIVVDVDPDEAVWRAQKMLAGDISVKELLLGIDPGCTPGIAAVGDGAVLVRALATSPESVADHVRKIVDEYPAAKTIVRVGNGDRTNRNRIFNSLWDSGYCLEIVDERNTTTNSATPDEDAAVEIAMTPGYRPSKKQKIEPRPGEIRNIQRLSRLESNGNLTVSKDLASRVASGEISLAQAVNLQRRNGRGET